MKRIVMAVALALGAGAAQAEVKTAVVAGGCFWCVESDFESVTGVTGVVSGFTGGTVMNPTYEQVSDGGTGHYEAVQITYDDAKVSYAELMRLFFRSVDPTDGGGQFCDRGDTYRTAVFVANPAETAAAKAAKAEAGKALGARIATKILPLGPFWPADEYHQDYYKKGDLILTRFGPRSKASAYKLYRQSCGRDQRVLELWGAEAPFVH